MPDKVKQIGMLLFDGCDLLDFAGPTAAFHAAGRLLRRDLGAPGPLYEVQSLSIDGGPVTTLQGVVVETVAAPRLADGDLDTLVVTGGTLDHTKCDPRLISWVAQNEPAIRRVASVCCGAFILCATGVLRGRCATTHWEDCEHLQQCFPDIQVQPDSIYVQEGKYWTAAGITAGIDMALAMIEQDHGHALALVVARNLVVFLKRPGGQSQFSTPLRSQTVEGPFADLLNWIAEHPHEDLSAEALAARANMSLRNFFRAFRGATGMSPAEWVELTRIETARRLLEQTAERVESIAFASGFGSYEALRKTFARRVGITPSAYRARFAPPGSSSGEPATYAGFQNYAGPPQVH